MADVKQESHVSMAAKCLSSKASQAETACVHTLQFLIL